MRMSRTGLVCLLLGCLVYSNTLYCGIVFDDEPAIVKNQDLRPERPWSSLLYHDFWGSSISHSSSHKSYRPLTVATFRLNYLFSGLESSGYHLINIILHGLVCYLYVRLVSLISADSALPAGLLFAVHPIHTEAVAGLVGRAELLSAVFYCSSLLVYHRAITHGHRWLVGTLLLVLCAMLSKEQGVTIVGVCVVYDFIVVHKMSLKSIPNLLHKLISNRKQLPKWWSGFIIRTSILATVTMVMILLRVTLVGGPPEIFNKNTNPAMFLEMPWRGLSWLYLAGLNVWLLLCPSALIADWRFELVPVIQSVCSPGNLLSLLLLLALALLASRPNRAVLAGLSLTLLPYLPASNLLFPVGFVVAERVLYLPSMGLLLLVAIGLRAVVRHSGVVGRGAFLCLLLVYGAKTLSRNQDWSSNTSLYSSGLKINPRNGILLTNLGIEHGRLKNYTTAESLYLMSMEYCPSHSKGFSNHGGLMEALRRYSEAELSFRTAIELAPKDSTTREVINTLDFLLDKIILREGSCQQDALDLVDQVMTHYPTALPLVARKGGLLQTLGRSSEALPYLEAAVASSPSPELLYQLGLAYADTGDRTRARDALRRVDPSYRDTRQRLAEL